MDFESAMLPLSNKNAFPRHWKIKRYVDTQLYGYMHILVVQAVSKSALGSFPLEKAVAKSSSSQPCFPLSKNSVFPCGTESHPQELKILRLKKCAQKVWAIEKFLTASVHIKKAASVWQQWKGFLV